MNIANTIEDESTKTIDRFKLLSIATREGIWEYDFVTKQSFYNEGIAALFGYSVAEMVDNNSWWPNNVHPADKQRITIELDRFLAGEETVWWGKYQFRCKDNHYKLILDRLIVVRNEANMPLRLMGTMQDFTELDALQQELDTIRKEHRHAMVKAIIEAEENERQSISEELHENINQVLAAINLHISSAKNHIAAEGLSWLEEAQEGSGNHRSSPAGDWCLFQAKVQ